MQILKRAMMFNLAVLSACAATQTPTSTQVNRADVEFITTVNDVAKFDDAVVGRELYARTSNPQVRALATDLLVQSREFSAKVMPIATEAGIRSGDDMPLQGASDTQQQVAALLSSKGHDFDREFLADEITAHEQALARRKAMINDPSSNPKLRQLAEEAGTILQTNLDRLKTLQQKLG